MSSVVVVGLGYVGLPMALRAAEVGHSVVGLDLNTSMVGRLNTGASHIDDVSESSLARGLEAGFRATTDPSCIADADVVVVCVPTPLSEDGGPDLTSIEATGRTIGQFISHGSLCILESTTYPGTTEEVFAPLVVSRGQRIGEDVFIAFSPERIDPGNHSYGVKNTPKVVGGLTAQCSARAAQFYASFVDTVVTTKGAKEAEMAKLLENTFRHVNIALVNEMVRFCQELEIDLWDAIDAAETKPFGFMAFRPGPGVGGHCIPVDPSYLSHRVKAKLGYAFRMVELAEEINHAAPNYVAERARLLLNEMRLSVKGSKILLLGVSYKPDISDQRESPALPLARLLLTWGADVRYFDTYVTEWDPTGNRNEFIQSVPNLSDALESSDLAILLQNHSTVDLDMLASCNTMVLDTRGVLEGHNVARL